ncbi:hypothetical protein EHQ58_00080 [Leptospira ognonensis]|uniref:Uncharacterized protein n=1 Tax=Leptospira ognonensis TaxID=2484945 RepID=A0A4R9KDS0_9LEPT|nr:hypothetical protein EHQ58_00080 [Leptospira ognonensis]
MSKYTLISRTSFFLILVFFQCVLFEPKLKTVPDAYVREEVMNEEQKNAVKVLKQKIVALNTEITALKKVSEVNAQTLKIARAKIIRHAATRDLLSEKEKLSLIKDDSVNAKRYLDESQTADLEKAKEETRLQAWTQKQTEDTAFLQMKEATQSELIAELELVRAEIAVKYQEFQGKTSKDPDFVEKQKYDLQYNTRKAETRKKTADWERIKNNATKLPKVNLEDTYLDETK